MVEPLRMIGHHGIIGDLETADKWDKWDQTLRSPLKLSFPSWNKLLESR